MNDELDIKIPQYLARLPKEVQDFMYKSDWEERVRKVAQKYSLNPEQTETLVDTTALVLIGIQETTTLVETLIADLNISRLLGVEIFKNLEENVINYAEKTIKKPEKEVFVQTLQTPISNIPEIRPENLPAKKADIVSKIFGTTKKLDSVSPEKRQENVQRPLSVPRFKAVPLENEGNETPKVVNESLDPRRVIDDKLTKITSDTSVEEKKDISIKPLTTPPSKPIFKPDPYREPIE